jgi:sugar lactone lactonase YvrE
MRWRVALQLTIGTAVVVLATLSPAPGVRASGGPAGTIATFAGGGVADGGPATSASLNGPAGVAVDSAGNLYVADYWNCRVRKVDTSGTITTVAGNGGCAYSGDGGPATAASLKYPFAVALDSSDVLYIADTWNCRIRKVDSGGTITTVAGDGVCAFSYNGSPATSSSLDRPSGIAIDTSGILYIADSGTCRVRKVDSNGVMAAVAGHAFGFCGFSGDGGPANDAMLSNPEGVAVSASGDVYIADSGNCRVRSVISGTISTVAGNGVCAFSGDGGPATSASIDYAPSLAVDSSDTLFIGDFGNCRVREVSGGTIDTAAGNGICSSSGDGGPATSASVDRPGHIGLDGLGALYIAEFSGCRVRRVDSGATISTVAGNGACGFYGDKGPAAAASLNHPWGIAADAAGNLYIVDVWNCRVRKVRSASGTIVTIAGNGGCAFAGDGGPAASASLADPIAVEASASGDLYITDSCRVRRVSSTSGTIITVAGNGVCDFSGDGGLATNASVWPSDVALDTVGNLYIADSGTCRVRKVDTAGYISTVAGNGVCGSGGDGGLATNASLGSPTGVSVDGSGNLLIAHSVGSFSDCFVRKVDTAGYISTVAGNGACGFSGDGGAATAASLDPHGVEVDASGNLYIPDADNCRVRKVDSAGYISTVAGNGVCGFSGDGGPATSASLYPLAAAVDGLGNLYITEQENNRVRVVSSGTKPAPPPSDADYDGCPDEDEQQAAPGSETLGGLRDYLNPNDYFNPTKDGQNRVDDVLVVLSQYFKDDNDPNPGQPPYAPGYNPKTDRTLLGPNPWNLGPPDGLQRVDDIVHILNQYFHDCA